MKMTLGERTRSLRKARGMTQQELADKLHTTKQTIGKYEQGIIRIPHGGNRAERRKRSEKWGVLAPIIS